LNSWYITCDLFLVKMSTLQPIVLPTEIQNITNRKKNYQYKYTGRHWINDYIYDLYIIMIRK